MKNETAARPSHSFHLKDSLHKFGHKIPHEVLLLLGGGAIVLTQLACGLIDRAFVIPEDPHTVAAEAAMKITPPADQPIPKATQRATPTAPKFAEDHAECAKIVDGGTVSEAVTVANHGEWPPYVFNGQNMLVLLDHNGQFDTAVLQDVMSGMNSSLNTSSSGDVVCISTDETTLQSAAVDFAATALNTP